MQGTLQFTSVLGNVGLRKFTSGSLPAMRKRRGKKKEKKGPVAVEGKARDGDEQCAKAARQRADVVKALRSGRKWQNGKEMALEDLLAKDEEAKMSYYAPVSTPSGRVSLITFAARTCLPLFRKYIKEIQEVRRKGKEDGLVSRGFTTLLTWAQIQCRWVWGGGGGDCVTGISYVPFKSF